MFMLLTLLTSKGTGFMCACIYIQVGVTLRHNSNSSLEVNMSVTYCSGPHAMSDEIYAINQRK
jgi:hypothetical protein